MNQAFLNSAVPASGLPKRRLLRQHTPTVQGFQQVMCALSVIGLLYLLTVDRTGQFDSNYRILMVLASGVGFFVYRMLGVFSRFARGHEALLSMLQAWAVTLAIIIAIGFFTKTSDLYSRQVLISWSLLGALSQGAIILGSRAVVRLWQNGMQNHLRSVMVGEGWLAEHLLASVNKNAFLPDKIVGLVDTGGQAPKLNSAVPTLGRIEDITGLVQHFKIDRIYLALPFERAAEMVTLQEQLQDQQVDLIWVPDIYAFNLVNPSVRELAGVPIISLSETPLASGSQAFLKSIMDRVLAAVLVVMLAPLFAILAILIKLDSKGPVIYRQMRHGWDGREFSILKFRSMVMHQESDGQVTQATKDDDRITGIGRFMRRTSLDELPQLFNVLAGTMSLVGPRPHAIAHNLEFASQIKSYMTRHRIKPGLTGWAQVQGHRGETDTVEKMQARVNLDLEYINNWSVALDIWILMRTPLALLMNKNVF